MTHCRFLKFMGIIAVLAIGSGCTLYQPRPVTFSVRDWDTGEPVEGAQVKVEYLVMLDFGVLFASVGPREGVTDEDGHLTLIVDPKKSSFRLNVSADGYPDTIPDGSPRWGRLVPGPWYSVRDEYQVRLIRRPRPTIEITFPNGYRGVVVVRSTEDTTPILLSGRRKFSYTASGSGLVDIKEGALFETVDAFDGIRARYQDGTTLQTAAPDRYQAQSPGSPADDVVALRFVAPKWEDHVWLYVIGTAAEAEAMYRTVWPNGNTFDDAAFKRIVQSR